jgi:hypothetical protein
MSKEIKKIEHSYIPAFEESPYEISSAKVGKDGVVEIKEHRAAGEGDKWYYDIIYENGEVLRTFNPYLVWYKGEEKQIF